MSVLDTFFILFEADASSLKKGTADAEKQADKLNEKLKTTDAVSSKMGSSFSNLLSTAGGALVAMMSVGAMVSGIRAAADYADTLNDLSGALGANIEDISAWGDAVQLSGGTAEGFQSTLSSMTADFNMVATKGMSRSKVFFDELGISMLDTKGKAREVMDVLPELAAKFETMSKSESLGMGQKMGLDQGTIMLLQQGKVGVEELIAKQKELGVVTKKDAETAAAFNDAMDDTKHAFRSLFMAMGGSILPAFQWLLEKVQIVTNFFRKNSDFAVGLFMALGAAILTFVIPPLVSAGIAAAVAFAPFLILGAIIAGVAIAFALLYDDIMAFMEGSDSLIGDISQKWPIVGEIVKGLVATLQLLWSVASSVFGYLGDLISDPENAWNNFKESIQGGIDELKDSFPALYEAITAIGNIFTSTAEVVSSVWSAIMSVIQSGIDLVMGAIDKVTGAYEAVKGIFGGGDVTAKVTTAQTQISAANSTPLNTTNSNTIQNSNAVASKSTKVSVGKVEVMTQATDATGISKSIGTALSAQMKQATNNFDNGVLA